MAAIAGGRQHRLHLGNLEARRDWGFAGDYVDASSVIAFGRVGLDYGEHVVVDERPFRPAEVDYLLGDPSKAMTELGWMPATRFDDLVALMVDADVRALAADAGDTRQMGIDVHH